MSPRSFKVDLHIHSSHSHDCSVPPSEVVKTAKNLGLHTIGVADHGTVRGGLEASRLAKGIKVLVGQEVLTKQGEVLVYNLETDLPAGEDVKKTCRLAKELGGFVVIPHPFDPLRQGIGKHIEKVLGHVDAIEAFNPKCFFDWSNRKAEGFAAERGIPAVAGSDAHKAEDIGLTHTRVAGEDALESIRSGEAEMVKNRLGKGGVIKRGLSRVRKGRRRK